MKVALPEWQNEIIKQAAESAGVEVVPAANLASACELVAAGAADTMVAGIDYTTRDVILACRDYLGVKKKIFSSCFVMQRTKEQSAVKSSEKTGVETIIVADAGVTKHPNLEQLVEIILQTHQTAKAVLEEEPRIAMLSFSTFGSGGRDETIELIRVAIEQVRAEQPEIKIDGEMQLDAAVNREIGLKKWQSSQASEAEPEVAGRANVLICPDLNAGNILYKALEQFGGFVAAGPILQGFKAPVSDLSRGSSKSDVLLVLETMRKLVAVHQKEKE